MLFIAIALNLLVVYAGATLLSRTQREVPGGFYKFIARFIIVMGLLGMLSAGCMLAFHLCGGHHHKSYFMTKRRQLLHPHALPTAGYDSIMKLYREGRCCPPVYCTEKAGDYGEETIFHPKNCVCCPDEEWPNSTDSIQ